MEIPSTCNTKTTVNVVLDRVRLRMVLGHMYFPGTDSIELGGTFWTGVHLSWSGESVTFLWELNIHEAESVVILPFPSFMFDMLLLVVRRRPP